MTKGQEDILPETPSTEGRESVEGNGDYNTPTDEMRGDGVIEHTAVRDGEGNPIEGERGTYIQDNDAGGTVKTPEEIQTAIENDVQTEYSPESAGMRDAESETNPSGVSDVAEQTGIVNAPEPESEPDLSDVRTEGENFGEEKTDEELANEIQQFLGK